MLVCPELRERLAAERSLVPAAVEESLRYKPPVLYLIRTCTKNVELVQACVTPEPQESVTLYVPPASLANPGRASVVAGAGETSLAARPDATGGPSKRGSTMRQAIRKFFERHRQGRGRRLLMVAALALACGALAPAELARAEGASEDEVVQVWVINVVVQSDGIPVAAYKYTYTDPAHC